MATIVLIHGAWTGGWLWSRVAADLRARGQLVYAPTLTGLGERDHLLGPDIDLELHATDVLNLLEYEDLQRAVRDRRAGLTVHVRAGARLPRTRAAVRIHPQVRPDRRWSRGSPRCRPSSTWKISQLD